MLYGAAFSGNFGGPCIFFSSLKILANCKEKHEIVFFPQSREHQKQRAAEYLSLAGVQASSFPRFREVIKGYWLIRLRKTFGPLIPSKLIENSAYLKLFKSFDVFIDSRGISQTDFFGSNRYGYFRQNIHLITAKLMGLKLIKLTQDMGPFLRSANRRNATRVLSKADLIFARGIIVKELLNEIGISKQVYVRPDSAFLMDASDTVRLQSMLDEHNLKIRGFVGVSCSRQVDVRSGGGPAGEQYSEYLKALAECITHITTIQNVPVLLIPNELSATGNGYDDLKVARKLHRLLNNDPRVRIWEKDVDAFDLKALISSALYTITSRYHSVVASLSTATPTLVIGWGFKYDQLMGLVNAPHFLINHINISSGELIHAADRLLEGNDEIRRKLEIIVPGIRAQVLSSSLLIDKLLSRHEA